MALRVGDPDSIVKPGDPVPFKYGSFYEEGQYAPNEGTLSFLKLLEVEELGFFLDHEIDIFNESGNLDEEKVFSFDVKENFKKFLYVENVSDDFPRFVAINAISVLNRFFRNLKLLADIETVKFVNHNEIPEALKNRIVVGFSIDPKTDKAELIFYQPYFVYMTVPIVKKVLSIRQGFSLSSFLTAKVYSKIIVRRLKQNFPDILFEWMEFRGWKKTENNENFYPSNSPYKLSKESDLITQRSTINPEEDLTDAIVFFFFHKNYLLSLNPDVVDKLTDFWKRI